MIIKEFIQKIFAPRHREMPETERLADALERLSSNQDFQLFRAVVQCFYATGAKNIPHVQKEVVERLRGEMFAYDRIFELTGESGIAMLRAQASAEAESLAERERLENELIQAQMAQGIY